MARPRGDRCQSRTTTLPGIEPVTCTGPPSPWARRTPSLRRQSRSAWPVRQSSLSTVHGDGAPNSAMMPSPITWLMRRSPHSDVRCPSYAPAPGRGVCPGVLRVAVGQQLLDRAFEVRKHKTSDELALAFQGTARGGGFLREIVMVDRSAGTLLVVADGGVGTVRPYIAVDVTLPASSTARRCASAAPASIF